jgi:hypothetical protein
VNQRLAGLLARIAAKSPGDLEDDERDQQPDERVGASEAECDKRGAGDNSQEDEAVYPRVVAVCSERGTRQSPP